MKPKAIVLRLFFLLLIHCIVHSGKAQLTPNDSLKKAINTSTGLAKAKNMLALADHLVEEGIYDSTCIFWSTEAEKIAYKLNDVYSVTRARELRARYYFNKSKWDESIRAYESALSAVDSIPALHSRNEMNFKALMGLAEVYNYLGDYVSALDYRLKGLKLIDSIEAGPDVRIDAYTSVANDFRHLNQRANAISYLRQVEEDVPKAKGNHQLNYYYEYYQDLLLNDRIEESKVILSRFDSGVAHFKLSTSQWLEFAGMAQKLHGQYELYHTNDFNKAVSFFKKYLDYSIRLDNQTHIAIAYNKIGIAYDSLKDYNKAIDAFKHSYDICIREQIIDYGYKSALQLSTLFERTGNYQQAYYFSSAAYSLKDKLDTETKLRELNLLEAKYQASRKEKQITDLKLVNAEHAVTESRQKQSLSNTRLMIAVLTIISLVILFIVYRYYHKKQLKEITIRNKISRDLHDDIGATLSSIKIYGELANSVLDDKPAESKAMIGKITEQSKDLMQRMGDVIWSMKSAEETNNSFTARIKNYSSELLAPKDISCEIDIDESMCSKISNPITRKHLLLIVKEALNNIAKYSAATEARINFKQDNDKFVLLISDNGKGFSNPDNVSGNGLGNMRQRCEQCHGTFKIDSIPGKGVTVTAAFPIAIISYTG